jgi:hypothetical protein
MLIESSKTVRRFKTGYEIREELWKMFPEDEPTLMRQAYTPTGDYIGDKKVAHMLCTKRGIKPEKSDPKHCVCSIGFCEKEQKWYGWSHRAIYGFGIGGKVKQGDCGFTPSNRKEHFENIKSWYMDDEMYKNVEFKADGNKIIVCYDIIQEKSGNAMHHEHTEALDLEAYGRGEWEAKTLEDAKQMAVDFAESVS